MLQLEKITDMPGIVLPPRSMMDSVSKDPVSSELVTSPDTSQRLIADFFRSPTAKKSDAKQQNGSNIPQSKPKEIKSKSSDDIVVNTSSIKGVKKLDVDASKNIEVEAKESLADSSIMDEVVLKDSSDQSNSEKDAEISYLDFLSGGTGRENSNTDGQTMEVSYEDFVENKKDACENLKSEEKDGGQKYFSLFNSKQNENNNTNIEHARKDDQEGVFVAYKNELQEAARKPKAIKKKTKKESCAGAVDISSEKDNSKNLLEKQKQNVAKKGASIKKDIDSEQNEEILEDKKDNSQNEATDKKEITKGRRREIAKQFLSLDSHTVHVPSKSTQMTLSFGSKGNSGNKIESAVNINNVDEGKCTKKPLKKKGKKSAAVSPKDEGKTVDVLVTEKSQKCKSSKRKKNGGRSKKVSESKDPAEAEFVSMIVDAGDENSSTPIKMKFNRVMRISSDEESQDFTPKSQKQKKNKKKQSKAQQLLMQAKQHSQKKQKKPSVKETKASIKTEIVSPPRRSSRSCAKHAAEAISLSFQKLDVVTRVKNDSIIELDSTPEKNKLSKLKSSKSPGQKAGVQKVKRVKNESIIEVDNLTPDKAKKIKTGRIESPKRTPLKKKAGKMAPIFIKKGVTKDEEKEDIKITKVDTEADKIKKAFLLSGIPEEMKRQVAITQTVQLSEYAPFPTTSHVQQIDTVLKLEADKLPLIDHGEISDPVIKPNQHILALPKPSRKTDIKTNTLSQQVQNKKALSADVHKLLVEEMYYYNPQFPARKMQRLVSQRCRVDESSTKETGPNFASLLSQNGKLANTAPKQKRKLELTSDAPKRKSKRLKLSDEAACISDTLGTESPVPEPKDQTDDDSVNVRDQHWSDKYAPKSGADVLGNSKVVSRMKTWLIEWKQRTDKEERRLKREMRKLAKKQGKPVEKTEQEKWLEEDSDFDLDSADSDSDYDEADDAMNNTMLIQGPPGVGKTALVYALAQELGYKVFEVNASSKRAGKHILTQLQEATQSHQVSKKNLEEVYSTFLNTSGSKKAELAVSKPKEKPSNKDVPKAFANFFGTRKELKCSEDNTPKSSAKGAKKKEKSAKKSEKCKGVKSSVAEKAEKVEKKGLDLASCSLVLFEEVDVIFEEDKGFLAAVQTFISTTKRPIILTTSDCYFADSFDARFEELKLRRPSPTTVASYLQVIALQENIRTNFNDVSLLVKMNNCDLRKSLMSLHFWVESGGSLNMVPAQIKTSSKKQKDVCKENVKQDINILQDSLPGSQNSEDEFDFPDSFRRKRFLNVIQDDSSRDSFTFSPKKSDVAISSVSGVDAPQLSIACFENSCGLQGSINTLLKTSLQHSTFSELFSLVKTAALLKQRNCDLIYCNLANCLNLPRILASSWRPPVGIPRNIAIQQSESEKVAQPTKRRRLMNNTDLFDSDSSNDSFISLAKKKGDENTTEVAENSEKLSEAGVCDKLAETSVSENESQIKPQKKVYTKQEATAAAAVHALSGLYDDFSLLDCFNSYTAVCQEEGRLNRTKSEWSNSLLQSGQSEAKLEDSSPAPQFFMSEFSATVSCLSVMKTKIRLGKVLETIADDDQKHMLSLPVEKLEETVKLESERTDMQSVGSAFEKAADNIASNLPTCLHTSKTDISVDYLPYLRDIAKTEQIREHAKTKRRFFHYLKDNLQLPFKDSTMDVLNTSFT